MRNLRVVLVNPPSSFERVYGKWDLSALDTYCPPLGLLYIAGYVRQYNHEVHIIDLQTWKYSLDRTVEYIKSLNPDVIGLSAMTINFLNANEIAEGLKNSGLTVPIILGGPHFTAASVETLKRFSAIDFGVVGEGEVTFSEILQKIASNSSVKGVKGVVWRSCSEGIVTNASRPLIENLDMLPLPAWDLLQNFPNAYPHNALETRRLPAASIITSRGCPYQCTFCDRSIFGNRVRHHSASYTLNMIRHLRDKYKIKDLMILDDNFLLDKIKLFEICNSIIQENMDVKWYCLSHVSSMTEDRLEKVKEAGCWIMEVGIESGNEKILRLLKRNTSKTFISNAVNRAKKLGIRVKGNFIFGLPTETLETLEETIRFSKSINLSLFQQTFLTIWPGCELSNSIDQYGNAEKDWDKLTHFQISFVPDGLTSDDLLRASKSAFRRFYLRPKIIFEILLYIRSFRALKYAIIAGWVFLKSLFRKN